MLGFYEELAEFAAMSEDQGFLGQCATEIAEPMRVDERKSQPQVRRRFTSRTSSSTTTFDYRKRKSGDLIGTHVSG